MKKIVTAAIAAASLALASPAQAHFYNEAPTAHSFNVNVLCNTGTWWCLEAYNVHGGLRFGLHTVVVRVYTARWRPIWTTQRFFTDLKIIHGGVVEVTRA